MLCTEAQPSELRCDFYYDTFPIRMLRHTININMNHYIESLDESLELLPYLDNSTLSQTADPKMYLCVCVSLPLYGRYSNVLHSQEQL